MSTSAPRRYVPPGLRNQQGDGGGVGELQRKLGDIVLDKGEEKKGSSWQQGDHRGGRGRGSNTYGGRGRGEGPPSGRRAEEEAARVAERELALEWHIFDPSGPTPLDGFVSEHLPSTLNYSKVAWVVVPKTAGSEQEQIDVVSLVAAWHELQQRVSEVGVRDIDGLAEDFKCARGKWLLFIDNDIDELWSKIATAVVEGKLGPFARVSPGSRERRDGREREDRPMRYAVQVYTDDYREKDDVFAVRDTLRGMLPAGMYMSYKPDIFSKLGIYKSNRWGLSPTVYQSWE